MLLDLDDTIIAYSAYAEPCWKQTCSLYTDRLDGVSSERLYETLLETRIWFWGDSERHRINRQNMRLSQQRVVDHTLKRLGIESWDLATEIAEAFICARQKTIQPFPGAIETLNTLQEHGIRMVLITNGASEPQREKINKFNLAPFFDAIFIEGERGYGKPDERIYHDALKFLGVASSETWMVGDNLEWEIAVPQKLGIFAVWNDPLGNGLPENTTIRPNRIIQSIAELVS